MIDGPLKAHGDHGDQDDFGGLQQDLRRTGASMPRRDLLRLALGAGVLHLLGCGTDSNDPGGNDACSLIPEETAGPFPGDGSNGPNALTQTGVVRSDIRSSFAGLSGSADGIPLSVALTIVSAATCAPLAGRAVYLWHCNRSGGYSLYSNGITNQNYLRGVQVADASGLVTFTTIFPGCYAGRWPHIHFEVYPTLAAATSAGGKEATSQIALPQAVCAADYATPGYDASVSNLANVSLATDNVFSDGAALELATVNGSVAAGYTAILTVAI
jgi:protocatechuate 3,4-dioxygenase beta subunit